MTVILAAIDTSASALPVLQAATAMARTLGADVRAVHILETPDSTAEAIAAHAGVALDVLEGEPAERIVRASADAAVGLVVMGARRHHAGHRPSGHVAAAVMSRVRKPLLVVPPNASPPATGRFERVLLPLEGTEKSSGAVAAALQALAAGGARITVVHVFRRGTMPRFWDQAGHARQSWTTEFLAHWCELPVAHLRLRSGDVADAVLDVAASEEADLIVLGWSQNMSGSRAEVVREILGRSEIAVLLSPVER